MAKDIRASVEALLTKVAKANKHQVTRAIPHGSSRSGIGALQVTKEGQVMISVRDHNVVIYVSPKTLKAGRPGPKGYENVAHFSLATDLKMLEKAFKAGLAAKRVKLERTTATKNIAAQKAALKAKLAALEKAERETKTKAKAKVIRKPKAEKVVPAPDMAFINAATAKLSKMIG